MSSSPVRPTTRPSRITSVRCSRRSIRCRSKTIRPRSSASGIRTSRRANDGTGAGMITLTLKEQPVVPLESEVLSPDVMASLSNAAIRALPVYLGKTQCRVEDFFTVEGEASDQLEIRGDARQVKWIGRGMSRGRIKIVGNAGMHTGAYMKGGSIEVTGNVSDWLGGEMSDGFMW